MPTFFRGLHGLMVAAWLLFDFLVHWLHFEVKGSSGPPSGRSTCSARTATERALGAAQ